MQRTARRKKSLPQARKMKIEVRELHLNDYLGLRDSMTEAYENWQGTVWKEEHIKRLISIFPEGQIVVLVNDKVVGVALTIIVNYDELSDEHTYMQVTGNYSFKRHNPKGDVLYGIEVFVHPEYRGLRLARRLYDARKELCERLNLRSIVFGGRIPNYASHASKMSPKEYINRVRMKEIYDPVLTFQLSNEFHVKKLLKNYIPGDEESKSHATLMEWHNVLFSDEKEKVRRKNNVRLGLIQWEMRQFANFDALCEQIEFFIDTVSGYNADFVVFPEYINAPLMADFNHLSESDAIRKLADFTEPLREKFIDFAITYNVNVITGSMPYVKNGRLYNIGYLCRRDGSYEKYTKLHVTPNEVAAWGIVGGSSLQVFETDVAKIGVLICYDVEFPELSRLLALEGMEILFVPFLTDTQNSYIRVRHCAQARAIENECYVALTGAVGNIPKIHNMDIQYAQSAVFTPGDFSFPTNGIKAEATPNTESVLIVDVDLDNLKKLHSHGSVRNMLDRRTDLYKLEQLKRKNDRADEIK
jgi:predicted amidohydrolase/GNAT superfamily N-acetyltransferase